MLLADAITWGQIGEIAVGGGTLAGAMIALIALRQKAAPIKIQDDPAIEIRKQPKRYNHDLVELRFGRIETRLDGHDAELDGAWSELKRLGEKNAERHTEIAVALAEIKVHLGIVSPSKK